MIKLGIESQEQCNREHLTSEYGRHMVDKGRFVSERVNRLRANPSTGGEKIQGDCSTARAVAGRGFVLSPAQHELSCGGINMAIFRSF